MLGESTEERTEKEVREEKQAYHNCRGFTPLLRMSLAPSKDRSIFDSFPRR